MAGHLHDAAIKIAAFILFYFILF